MIFFPEIIAVKYSECKFQILVISNLMIYLRIGKSENNLIKVRTLVSRDGRNIFKHYQ